jgi:hypothetical protein
VPKRKVFYPPAKTSTKRRPLGEPEVQPDRPTLARINLTAAAGQLGFAVGDRVRIEAAGTYSGEVGTIERLSTGVIPSAVVRMGNGGSRQVRTIDLSAAPAEPPAEN